MIRVAGPALTQRIYERLCLASALVIGLVVIPANAVQRLPWEVNGLAAAFAILSVVLYRSSRRGHCYPSAFLAGMVLAITFMWFPNAGSIGSIPLCFLPAVTYAAIFFRGRVRAAVVCLIVADALALMAIEHFHPELLTPFVDDTARQLDLALGITLSAFLTAIMLWVATDAYDNEQRSREATVTALAEAREEFARLFQMNPDAVYLVDPAVPEYVDVNHGFERLSGWSKAEVVGRNAQDIRSWVDLDERDRCYAELARQGYLQNFVSRFRRRDNSEIWGSTSAAWIDISSRRLLLLTTRDITTQVEAQRRDAESRALLAALIDSTSDGVWQVEPTRFAFSAFNAAFAERFRREWGAPPVLGKTLEELISPEIAATWRQHYERTLADGPFSFEYAHADGKRTAHVSLSPVTHEGEVFGVSVFSRDITRLKTAARERAQIQQQLLQSQKMESLGSLAGGVAHDFNNMLTAIMGYAEMLLSDEPAAERRAALQAITQAATRSRELTGKLLAFGRRGKNIVQAVDLGAVVRDSTAMLRPSFRADVIVDLDCKGRRVVDGDPSQMSQVVVNLCINANEAMPSGGRLTISTADLTLDDASAEQAGVPAGAYVQLCVSDTGIGMAENVRARVFEPFFTTKVGGQLRGTGLGLSTVYGIVQSHGGNIVVDSAEGRGTTFTCYLPMGRLELEAPKAPPSVSTGTGVILIAEDEDLVRRLLVAATESCGYRALAAIDGEDAVRVFAAHQQEITGVVLDLKMPRKSGTAAFHEIRALAPQIPVLICSGYGDNEEAQKLITLGARGLLAKPFGIAELAAHLSRMSAPGVRV